jgi:[ribosomal protein S5]-alanine N-acetyltransferase
MTNLNYEIKTERLLLRPLQDGDVPKMFEILQKYPDITKFMTFDPPQKEEETRAFFEASQKSFPEEHIRWGIFLKEEFIGTISFDDIKRTRNACKLDKSGMGYWLNPEYHNQGIMTEAGKALLKFGFEKLQLHKVVIGHISDNTASQKVIEKMGFRYIGEHKNQFFRFEKWWSEKIYEINADEFKQ